MKCRIGSCAMVEDGAPCVRSACSEWGEEVVEKEYLWEVLDSKLHGPSRFARLDIIGFKRDIGELIADAIDLLDGRKPSEARTKLKELLVEIGEE